MHMKRVNVVKKRKNNEEYKKENINFSSIEKKWQKAWKDKKIFEVKEESKKKKFYIIEMYPYPSGSGLHMGHAFNYALGDIYARMKIMQGLNVLHPMGYDSFGLPAENAAIKAKSHPKKFTEEAIENFINQQKTLGITYDWNRILMSHDSNYYRWDQWIFLKMFEKGLAYRKKAPVNFCSKCKTVLANEQVHDGKCWRHTDTKVEIKQLEQWFFKITDYANELYDKIDSLNKWPERIKAMQKNWIGKSHGTRVEFNINNEKWPIFTTRPDTIFGVTFMVISAQHPKLYELVTKEQKKEVDKFVNKIKSTSEKDLEGLEKEGAFTGSYAINPVTKEKIPVYTGNFVLAEYGSGMVMAVPAHDQRDFEFAKRYNIPIKIVIQPENQKIELKNMKGAYVGDGKLINSQEFDGLNNREAISKITEFLEKNKLGKKTIQFKLRDWLISRQRFWGTPIPIIYCDKCGTVSVPEKDLPVTLPENIKFTNEKNPLINYDKFVNVKCPKCKGNAKRETDTMDTFVNSSWYFLRYCDSKNKKEIFDKKKVNYWCPIDVYIGGAEHACMHLIYFRFYTKFLRDLGLLSFDEPAKKLFNQGMLHGEDGYVMSKSRGNVIDPLETMKKYGVDTLRLFLVSVSSPDKDSAWSSTGIESMHKFVNKFVSFILEIKKGKSSERAESKINKAIKEITKDLEEFQYNLAIIKLRTLVDILLEEKEISKKDIENILKLISPFCPHITEELWEKIGNKPFISLASWPIYDEKKINEELEKQEQQVNQTIGDIKNIIKIMREKQNKNAGKVYLYLIPKEIPIYQRFKEMIEKSLGLNLEIFAVNDSKKYDPQNKAQKAKPGKPAIYLE